MPSSRCRAPSTTGLSLSSLRLALAVSSRPPRSSPVPLGGLGETALPKNSSATDFYHKTGVLLFTSQWDEPFALTVVEAMSCGTYIAATATGGTAEIVTPKTGLLLPRASIETTGPMLAALPTAPTRLIEEQLAAARAAAGNKTIRQMAESLTAFAGGGCAAS
jgi:glycosyltransferase involved in cell wall biosynthesis